MKKLILALAIVSILLLAGCGPEAEDTEERGETVTVISEQDGEEVVVTTTEGDDSWCAAGSSWHMTGPDDTTGCKVIRLETSGEYRGLCHVICTMMAADEEVEWKYWFDESGDNGFVEMDINGQKIKQEWHG
ncbi:YgdI/YgdR family lipoprotein [Candidatus Woesearchaeota archaeon]|nr:YgdI/YgdR family lipoprotein [Candidatus Woesearchaeota archaeon]